MKRFLLRLCLFILQRIVRLAFTAVALAYAIADTFNFVFIILFLYILYLIFIKKDPIVTHDIRFTIFTIVITGLPCLIPSMLDKVCEWISDIDYWLELQKEALKEGKG